MKLSNCVVLGATLAVTCGAAVFKEPAFLSGTAVGLVALSDRADHKQKTKPLPVNHLPTHKIASSPKVSSISVANALPHNNRDLTKARLYIDGPNVMGSSHEHNLRVNYRYLIEALEKRGYSIEKTYVYAIQNLKSPNYHAFLKKMKKLDIEVIEREVRKAGNETIRKDIDTWLATDISLGASVVDTLILVTGDGDFNYTVKRLQEMKKKLVVIGVEADTNKELKKQADRWLDIQRLSHVCERRVKVHQSPAIAQTKSGVKPVYKKSKRNIKSVQTGQTNRSVA